jgi:hypothetical protein
MFEIAGGILIAVFILLVVGAAFGSDQDGCGCGCFTIIVIAVLWWFFIGC